MMNKILYTVAAQKKFLGVAYSLVLGQAVETKMFCPAGLIADTFDLGEIQRMGVIPVVQANVEFPNLTNKYKSLHSKSGIPVYVSETGHIVYMANGNILLCLCNYKGEYRFARRGIAESTCPDCKQIIKKAYNPRKIGGTTLSVAEVIAIPEVKPGDALVVTNNSDGDIIHAYYAGIGYGPTISGALMHEVAFQKFDNRMSMIANMGILYLNDKNNTEIATTLDQLIW